MTHATRHALAALALFCAIAATPDIARAAQDYDNCTGFIESLPATIGTQGTWCLDQNLSTAITSGPAVIITANNITLDCNGFKIGGLAAGDDSSARGVAAGSRTNVTVRDCSIRGFLSGIFLQNAAHAVVEDNRLDGNLRFGIYAHGENSRIERNAVLDTGGFDNVSYGISASADVIDNVVSGVFGAVIDGEEAPGAHGIKVHGTGLEIRGNRVRGLVAENNAGWVHGITVSGPAIRVRRNHVSLQEPEVGHGIWFQTAESTAEFCTGNTVANFTTAYQGCDASYGNLSL